jgi:hypothetical protein
LGESGFIKIALGLALDLATRFFEPKERKTIRLDHCSVASQQKQKEFIDLASKLHTNYLSTVVKHLLFASVVVLCLSFLLMIIGFSSPKN